MDYQNSQLKVTIAFIMGILGALLMAGGDWLMIYGDTAFDGTLAWLTRGVAEIPAGRNSFAMFLAFPAILLYTAGLFGIRNFIENRWERDTYTKLTTIGLTPWLCLHLFYVMILFVFSWLHANGHAEIACELGEAMFDQFAWIVVVAEAIMVIPFLYMFILILRGRTVLPKWFAFNNPLIYYIVLKLITLIMPDTGLRLAFVNGLMSESMMICFALFLWATDRYLTHTYKLSKFPVR